MQTLHLGTDRAAPRRLPPPRWPAFIDRAAEHPRAWWTVTAVCAALTALILAVWALGGPQAVTDWNGPPNLKPGIPEPTAAAPPATEQPSHSPAPARPAERPSTRPTGPASPAPTASTATTPQETQMPPQPRERRNEPAPAQPADPAPEPTETEPQPDPTPDARPGCQRDGVTYKPGDPGYDECVEHIRNRGR